MEYYTNSDVAKDFLEGLPYGKSYPYRSQKRESSLEDSDGMLR
jgi:hypothetical protein